MLRQLLLLLLDTRPELESSSHKRHKCHKCPGRRLRLLEDALEELWEGPWEDPWSGALKPVFEQIQPCARAALACLQHAQSPRPQLQECTDRIQKLCSGMSWWQRLRTFRYRRWLLMMGRALEQQPEQLAGPPARSLQPDAGALAQLSLLEQLSGAAGAGHWSKAAALASKAAAARPWAQSCQLAQQICRGYLSCQRLLLRARSHSRWRAYGDYLLIRADEHLSLLCEQLYRAQSHPLLGAAFVGQFALSCLQLWQEFIQLLDQKAEVAQPAAWQVQLQLRAALMRQGLLFVAQNGSSDDLEALVERAQRLGNRLEDQAQKLAVASFVCIQRASSSQLRARAIQSLLLLLEQLQSEPALERLHLKLGRCWQDLHLLFHQHEPLPAPFLHALAGLLMPLKLSLDSLATIETTLNALEALIDQWTAAAG